MLARTSENRKNTEFATILAMGLRETYPGRDLAVLAHGTLEDTHTEHPAALGPYTSVPRYYDMRCYHNLVI